MSLISISDLPSSTALDHHRMAAVRGGHSWNPNVQVNLSVNQQIAQIQDINLSVLNNNGAIGAGFTAPDVNLAATQKATNKAVLPKFF